MPKELSAVILGLDPRIHGLTGSRVLGRDNTNAAALATVCQPLNHPASRIALICHVRFVKNQFRSGD